MWKFLFLVLFLTVLSQEENVFPIYGKYCGLWHTSYIGEQPVNDLDRLCQYHDICVARGYLDCYCNSQLYVLLMNLEVVTREQIKTKNDILWYLHAGILWCTNYANFDLDFYLAGTFDLKGRGFNYLPFYVTDRIQYIYTSPVAILQIEVKQEYYLNFTKELYEGYPKLPDKTDWWKIVKNGTRWSFWTNHNPIILWSKEKEGVKIRVEKMC